jgi:hypothetical protein
MITREFRKLWQGKIASLRDYEVKNAIKNGGMIFKFRGKVMTKTPNELAKHFQCHTQDIRSKFNNKTFKLVDFTFIPDDKKRSLISDKQLNLL